MSALTPSEWARVLARRRVQHSSMCDAAREAKLGCVCRYDQRVDSLADDYDAAHAQGHADRDAEVAELRAEVGRLRAALNDVAANLNARADALGDVPLFRAAVAALRGAAREVGQFSSTPEPR